MPQTTPALLTHQQRAEEPGARHRNGGLVRLEPGNGTQLLQATFLFGACAICFQFPDTAMSQFKDDEIWDVRPDAQIEGGHYEGGRSSPAPSTRRTTTNRSLFSARRFFRPRGRSGAST